MPEGDTIRRLAERINRRFAGQRCTRTVTRDPRLVGVDFSGSVLVGADAHGKHLLVRFDDGRSLFAHLRLDGSFVVGPAADAPAWKRRIELWMEDGRLTGVDVPILGVVATANESSIVGHLGPDLCGPEIPDLDLVVLAHDRRTRSNHSPRRYSISATSPASATSTPSSCRSSSGSRRSSRSAPSTACPA